MKEALRKLDESIDKYDNADMKDYFINLIIDRAKNNIGIEEVEDDGASLDLTDFIRLIKNDLKDYQIVRKKEESKYCTCNAPNVDTYGEKCINCYKEILW